jgi:virginiamycin A acetyltransferase
MSLPKPSDLHPTTKTNNLVYLKALITNPNIHVGDYTYYFDPEGPMEFETKNVLYLHPHFEDHLTENPVAIRWLVMMFGLGMDPLYYQE